MHTRVLTFTGAKNIDGGVDYLRQKALPVVKEQKGYRGVTATADRSGGVFGILSIWETESDRDTSESALNKARQEALDIVGGNLTVEVFEQVLTEVSSPPGPGSALIVQRVSMDPATVDENIAFFKNEILPQIKVIAGFKAARNMMNRKTGEGAVGTIWENQDAMKAAADQALARRPQGVARGISFGDTSLREILFTDLP